MVGFPKELDLPGGATWFRLYFWVGQPAYGEAQAMRRCCMTAPFSHELQWFQIINYYGLLRFKSQCDFLMAPNLANYLTMSNNGSQT